jgi:protocatechuate 3,4-dioxygenase beta subunit
VKLAGEGEKGEQMSSNPEEHGLATPDSEELILVPKALPTYSYDTDEEYQQHVSDMHFKVSATQEESFLGPYFRLNAPYRAKISPPHESGKTLIIKGHVWAHDDKRPLEGVRMDIWQANAAGKYDNEDKKNPPGKGAFINRASVFCDSNGYYEFETVHPGAYRRRRKWRAPHIHFRVIRPGYVTLITQLFFEGDPHHKDDPFIKDTLIIKLREKERSGVKYEEGVFDIVLGLKTVEA